MARPAAPLLLTDKSNPDDVLEILQSEAIFAVYYDGKPINIRRIHTLLDRPAKYVKCSFSNPAHAFNLAIKLNKRFKTDKFTVFKMAIGEQIFEDVVETTPDE